ncbi:MAG: aldehyde dehydrogenase family protein [Pseudomonadota bacterium]
MTSRQKTISPVDGSVFVERVLATPQQLQKALNDAQLAQKEWLHVGMGERVRYLHVFVDAMLAKKDAIAEELTWQMGRPISQTPGELRGFEERARYMINIAESALSEIDVGEKPGFRRFIRREPLGVVFVVAPWNYPFLTSVNSVVPALMAGNAVILKHSKQTPLVAERYAEAAQNAGLPKGLFQYLHMNHQLVEQLISDNNTAYVAFTGSVEGGRAVHQAAADRFISVGLELGGKDPAYVRPDAVIEHAIETLVDGSYFNSGQSCCGIERIYVHEDIYDSFLNGFVELTRQYKLGNPTEPETNLGPVVRVSAASAIRAQIEKAVAAGARKLINEKEFPASKEGTTYLAPQVLVDVNHSMEIMSEETFGPVVGIMRVKSDDEAIRLMNDSRYGLTAAIFTKDIDAAIAIGNQVETGTWFMNRCDYLDPALAWVGVKDTGRGCTLSRIGYEQLTRPKSFHLKIVV